MAPGGSTGRVPPTVVLRDATRGRDFLERDEPTGAQRSGVLPAADQLPRRRRANFGHAAVCRAPTGKVWRCARWGGRRLEARRSFPARRLRTPPSMRDVHGPRSFRRAKAGGNGVEPRLCETAERAEAGRQRPLTFRGRRRWAGRGTNGECQRNCGVVRHSTFTAPRDPSPVWSRTCLGSSAS